mgnify:CR=1 FL=1
MTHSINMIAERLSRVINAGSKTESWAYKETILSLMQRLACAVTHLHLAPNVQGMVQLHYHPLLEG